MGNDKPYKCDVSGCGAAFANEQGLKVHKKRKHKAAKAKDAPIRMVPGRVRGAKKPFKKRPKDDE
jgi:hypothetical protein